ncbi:hypothetical protein AVDCRST_MAG94-1838 [uncultured Leptolyngbya sp.]|uniref:Uncharacterized protein n=1 Tax=uncultured Leptolyngbya sp. TaxID=332963 RepID=A0A6J4LE59_9CYAN|nr:hypothetical protein AVDCRST_MAG94-1838 [uncultured Leptolyngbya sp.]
MGELLKVTFYPNLPQFLPQTSLNLPNRLSSQENLGFD